MFHHEVGVKGQLRMGSQAGDERHAKGQVGHEVAVHEIEVQAVGAAFFYILYFIGQAGKISR